MVSALFDSGLGATKLKNKKIMEKKHTDCKWHAVYYAGFYSIQTTDMYSEGNLLDEDHYNEAKYNAKLMAAAPELLEALKLLIDNGFQTPSNKDMDIAIKAYEKATE